MTNIILTAYDVVDEIRDSENYVELDNLNKYIKKNLKSIYQKYIDLKVKFDDILSKGGKYHPDFKEVSQQLLIEKNNFYNNEYVKRHMVLQRKLQKELNILSNQIGSSISNNLSTPNEFGFVVSKKGSCK